MAAKNKPALTKAYRKFEGTIRRSLDLLTLYEALSKLRDEFQVPALARLEISDTARAAIVLSVAAMDTYFTDVFSERLNPFLMKLRSTGREIPSSMVELLTKAGLDTRLALELLTMNRPRRRLKTIVDTHLERHTTQRFEAVNDLFLAFGIKCIIDRAESKRKRKNLQSRIQALVRRRHQIAHGGDLNDHGKLVAVDAADTRKRITELLTLVSSVEEILANATR